MIASLLIDSASWLGTLQKRPCCALACRSQTTLVATGMWLSLWAVKTKEVGKQTWTTRHGNDAVARPRCCSGSGSAYSNQQDSVGTVVVVLTVEGVSEESMDVHDGKVKSTCAVGDEKTDKAVWVSGQVPPSWIDVDVMWKTNTAAMVPDKVHGDKVSGAVDAGTLAGADVDASGGADDSGTKSKDVKIRSEVIREKSCGCQVGTRGSLWERYLDDMNVDKAAVGASASGMADRIRWMSRTCCRGCEDGDNGMEGEEKDTVPQTIAPWFK